MYQCKKCKFETDKVSVLANHYQYAHSDGNAEHICDKCGKKFKNKNGLNCHTEKMCDRYIFKTSINHICPKCNLFINNHISEHIRVCDGRGTTRIINKMPKVKICVPNNSKGKTYEDLYGIEKAKILKDNLSKMKKGQSTCSDIEKERERRRKLSEIAKRNNYGGYKAGSGRGKSGWYKGYWCDSSYELAFAIYHLDHHISFERNKESFNYTWLGKVHRYTPDFLKDGTLIEIKGYESNKEKTKYASVSKPLIILKYNDLRYVFDYVVSTYGKDFINMYDTVKYLKTCSICGGYLWKYNKNGICRKCINKYNICY